MLGDVAPGRNLDGVEGLPRVGGVEAAVVVDVGDHDVEVNGVSGGPVVHDRRSIVVLRVKLHRPTAERLEQERHVGPVAEGRLEDGVLRVLEGLRDDLELREIAGLHGLGGAGGEVREGGAVVDLLPDLGDDLGVLGRDSGEGDVGGRVSHGEGVGPAGGTLAELGDGLGVEGRVVGDFFLVRAGGVV